MGQGMAQIFGSVSKEMHDEFDISYMIETIGRCGYPITAAVNRWIKN